MSSPVRKAIVVIIVVAALLSGRNSVADGEHFYESLPNVSIGKVFFSPQQRAELDQRRGSPAAVVSSGAAASGSPRKKVNKVAAGFILSSKGTSKVYADGDFVNSQESVAVKFPGSVTIVRGEDPDDAEASDEAD